LQKNVRLFTGLPKWWQAVTHDIALLKSIDKHGYGRWEEVCSDPDLPFFSIVQSTRERMGIEGKSEKEANERTAEEGEANTEREEGEISDENMELEEGGDGGDTEEGHTTTEKMESSSGKGTKRNRELLNRQILDFPRETVIHKRIDYLLKVALSNQISDFAKRDRVSSSSTTTTTNSSQHRTDSTARKQTSLDSFVKERTDRSKKEKKRKREGVIEDKGSKDSPRKKSRRSTSPSRGKERREKDSKPKKAAVDKSSRPKKVVDLPTDEHGKVKLPIKIAGLTILSLGKKGH